MVAEEGDTLHGPALGVLEIKERWPVPVLVGDKLLELATNLVVSPASSCQIVKKHRPRQTWTSTPLEMTIRKEHRKRAREQRP